MSYLIDAMRSNQWREVWNPAYSQFGRIGIGSGPDDPDMIWMRPKKKILVPAPPKPMEARKLRRWVKAANDADGLPTSRRDIGQSMAVAAALRRLQAHTAEQGARRRKDQPETWEHAATRIELQIELRRAMAETVGETVDLSGAEKNVARHRAVAARLRGATL